ncbi:hypothetical protein [Streptomyces liangshanensis]|uniref:Uncharacterized protein n=1 Tax=Streptomyces liangshanensis TaxID=2717324 RepID=A0A6G9H2M9_9ACTN|nr:hypothetical protein [Streptomyces liangshanensis]QIQ04387.1 hypothetical protein HA039_20630 [Streptomyces liangshanensis]
MTDLMDHQVKENGNDDGRQGLARLHRPLAYCAAAMGLLAVTAVVGMAVDERTLLGEGVWLKPFKFAVSFGLYALTLAWMIGRTRAWRRTLRVLGTVAVVGFIAPEISIITFQAARGVRSHFNVSTTLDDILVKAMGGAAYLGWGLTLVLGVLLMLQRRVDRPMAWAIPLGVFISLAGMSVGFLMTTPTPAQADALDAGGSPGILGAHTVGAPDGGPGMPLTGWASGAGDLRVAHFVGLHALQLVPLVAIGLGLLATRVPVLRDAAVRTALVVVAALGHATFAALLLWHARRGLAPLDPDTTSLVALTALAVAMGVSVLVILRTGARRGRRLRGA